MLTGAKRYVGGLVVERRLDKGMVYQVRGRTTVLNLSM